MRATEPLTATLLAFAIAGCTHPIDIIGEGDIRSASGDNDCLLEELPCEAVAVNEYVETYSPQARPGFTFVGWENCPSPEGDNCAFDVSAEVVHDNWNKTVPALVAKFAPVCEAAPADSFAAIQTVIFDGRGCSSSSCHRSPGAAAATDLSSGNAYNSIVDVTARSGGGLKRVLPGDADNSYLYRKVAVKTTPGSFSVSGSPMPLNSSVLSSDELAALAAWIDAGAPQFGRADEFNQVEQLLGLCD
jgi:mono/diheme cytochrome c family protein